MRVVLLTLYDVALTAVTHRENLPVGGRMTGFENILKVQIRTAVQSSAGTHHS